ncbi:hypothetical protein SAMN06265348_113210 [Pedobacter westerhofensis]|uniref:Uncharacterized protein n=1 Tax=Pedobacter westerhofensis TaxID=425512 RepID=A0A521FL96_9SPHI|nr:hypothetical protein [Pedobacter westerhofensis]SMO97003.1 hypothetical protein SAMN06265348_113210 [Pedobacter westerhofensis]
MEEIERLEEEGYKVTTGEDQNTNNQNPDTVQPQESGNTDLDTQDSNDPDPLPDHDSLPSDGPVSESEGDNNRPDLNNIEENTDPEPGVPEDEN